MRIPDPALVRELVAGLEGEVNNGGFHQFFFNSTSDRTTQILQALKAIGAVHTVGILERACSKFPDGLPPADRFERQEVLLSIAPKCTEFDIEDAEFYAYQEDLRALVEIYSRG